MTRCKYYREEYIVEDVKDESGKIIKKADLRPFCHGIQPHEQCYCRGDKNDCDFYPEELQRGKKR